MITQFDESQWPDLTKFRDACLDDLYGEMLRIAELAHHWYQNENPESISMEKLARIFQAQHYSSENNLQQLEKVISADPWTINHPWTAQGWLPITQAVSSHGDRKLIEFLLDHGADPTLLVGGPNERTSVPGMARYGGHDELALWLEQIIDKRGVCSRPRIRKIKALFERIPKYGEAAC